MVTYVKLTKVTWQADTHHSGGHRNAGIFTTTKAVRASLIRNVTQAAEIIHHKHLMYEHRVFFHQSGIFTAGRRRDGRH
ncbi:MAG: hypothetical protein KAX50_09000, partial [Saprospiraceae bacterium]|nr:hypothetical protein [Saprospiraceae bacterium]